MVRWYQKLSLLNNKPMRFKQLLKTHEPFKQIGEQLRIDWDEVHTLYQKLEIDQHTAGENLGIILLLLLALPFDESMGMLTQASMYEKIFKIFTTGIVLQKSTDIDVFIEAVKESVKSLEKLALLTKVELSNN